MVHVTPAIKYSALNQIIMRFNNLQKVTYKIIPKFKINNESIINFYFSFANALKSWFSEHELLVFFQLDL